MCLALAGASLAGVAGAQGAAATARPLAQALTGAARADYDAGKVLASDGDFTGALIKFQSAYDQSRDPRLLWNVAFCEKNLRHYARVIATLQRYLAEGAGFLTDKDRKEARDLVQTIQPFTTSATFKVSEAGAQISVDDAAVGVSPLAAPVVLDIGERRLRVVKEGFKPYEKTLPVGGSAAIAVDVVLEKEVHEGRIVVEAPPDATIVLDDKPAGTGRLEATVAAGGHQLRVTAPGMRPFQSEVVIQDKETRSLQVALEREGEPDKPRIRLAVGCDGPEPRGPDDGLVVYLDGPGVLAPANVKKTWSDERGRNVVDYVEYPAGAGKHTLRARIPDCESLETPVEVRPGKGADVTGALESDTPLLLGGPQGSPGRWRVGAGAWMFRPGALQLDAMPESYQGGVGAAAGVVLEGAVLWRWFGLTVQTAWGTGSMQRATFTSNYALPSTPSLSVFETTVRPALRVPLNIVAVSLGPQAQIVQINLDQVDSGKMRGGFGAWAGIDVQPLCDWGVNLNADASMLTGTQGIQGDPVETVQIGIFFEPNARCRRERSTRFGLFPGGP